MQIMQSGGEIARGGGAVDDEFFIVLCTYNPDLRFLDEQISSIERQTHRNWRCFVSDDRSPADKFEWMQRRLARDPRFVLSRNPVRYGVVGNFENGLYHAPESAAFVCFSDQDDVWEPDKLAVLLDHFRRHSSLLCHSDLTLIDADGRVAHKSCFEYEDRSVDDGSLPNLVVRNSVTGCACAFRAALLGEVLPFPRFGPRPPMYHDLWIALVASLHGEIGVVRRPLVRYRQHGGNVLGAVARPRGRRSPAAAARELLKFLRQSHVEWAAREAVIRWFLEYVDGREEPVERRAGSDAEVRELRRWSRGGLLDPSLPLFARRLSRRRDPNRSVATELVVGRSVGRVSAAVRGGVAKYRQARGTLGTAWRLGRRALKRGGQVVLGRRPARAPVVSGPVSRPLTAGSLTGGPPAVNVVVPTLMRWAIYGGMATALRLAVGLAEEGCRVRFITTDRPPEDARVDVTRQWLTAQWGASAGAAQRIDVLDGTRPLVGLSRNDRFLATAWWTAQHIARLLDCGGFRHRRFAYLIQDFEPGFYPWSDDYAQALATYRGDAIPVVNSRPLAEFLETRVGLPIDERFVLQPQIEWERYGPMAEGAPARRRRKRVFAYGRPNTPRNMFGTLARGLERWLQSASLSEADVEVASAGEPHAPVPLANGVFMRSLGKLGMDEYAYELRSSDIGVSLMLSPHPSYPPFEMAASGLITVTNRFENKDLRFSDNVISCDPTPEGVAEALAAAWDRAADGPGRLRASRFDLRELGRPLDAVVRQLMVELFGRGEAAARQADVDFHKRPA